MVITPFGIAVGTENGNIIIFNKETGEIDREIKLHHKKYVNKLLSIKNYLVSKSMDQIINVFDLEK